MVYVKGGSTPQSASGDKTSERLLINAHAEMFWRGVEEYRSASGTVKERGYYSELSPGLLKVQQTKITRIRGAK